MKKITQNFTNVKVWQSIMVAFIFLLSLTTFSQTCPTDKFNQDPVVGDQLGENVTIHGMGKDQEGKRSLMLDMSQSCCKFSR